MIKNNKKRGKIMNITDYKKNCYLGGKIDKEYKYNIHADKMLKKPQYSEVYSNKRPLKSITFHETKMTKKKVGNTYSTVRACSGKSRKGSELRRISDLRQTSLDENGWYENINIHTKQTTVQRLKSKKLSRS